MQKPQKQKDRFHIVSLGTSILSNLRNRKCEGFVDMPPLGHALEEWLLDRRADKTLRKAALEFLKKDPYAMSAELNGMRDFLEKNQVDEVYMIATDTEAGRFCHEVLEDFFNQKGIRVESAGRLLGYYKIEKNISTSPEMASEMFREHLHTLFNKLIDLIRRKKREGKQVFINATGGFKAEMAVLSLVGTLFMVRTYYRHESFGTAVFMPPFIPPAVFPEEIDIMTTLYHRKDNKIVGKEFEEMYKQHKKAMDALVEFKVLEFDVDEETDFIYGVSLTPQGKFWVEVGQRIMEEEVE